MSSEARHNEPGSISSQTGKIRIPPQIKFIVGNEACERFSYYGMFSILVLYLKNEMRLDEGASKEIAHLFATAVYFLPLLGGWLADRWLGRFKTILSISIFYCLGHAALAFFGRSPAGLAIGLTCIAIGSGGIKPCVAAFVGDQLESQDDATLTRVYGLFYWSVNLGAFFGFALVPLLRDHAGYEWAFGIPGLSMLAATLIFWMGSPHYRKRPPSRGSSERSPWSVFYFALRHRSARRPGQRFLDVAEGIFTAREIETARTLGSILLIFAPIPIFWALFNQINTTWVLQGEKMRPFAVAGFKVDAERIQSVGAFLVLLWVPLLTFVVYPLLERHGFRPTPLRRMGTGMLLGAISFFVSGWIQARLNRIPDLSLAWQLAPYIILEAGEVMLSATALEFAFDQAPASLKSMIMSLWLLTIAGGHFLVAVITGLNERFVQASGAAEFFFYATFMLIVTGGFALLAARYRTRSS